MVKVGQGCTHGSVPALEKHLQQVAGFALGIEAIERCCY